MNKMICIVCPVGCRLSVDKKNTSYVVQGNQCKRGEGYAINELKNPLRTVTSTVRINDLHIARLPVKTKQAFPKGKIFELMTQLKELSVKLPVQCGQVILENALDTGVDVVSTKTITI